MIWSLVNIILVLLHLITGRSFTLGPAGCRSNPIRCDGPAGEHAYLERSRSHDGRKLLYFRQGSLGIPSPFGNIVDVYLIGLEDVGPVRRIYMDMYFEGYVDERPISGCRLIPPESPPQRADVDAEPKSPGDGYIPPEPTPQRADAEPNSPGDGCSPPLTVALSLNYTEFTCLAGKIALGTASAKDYTDWAEDMLGKGTESENVAILAGLGLDKEPDSEEVEYYFYKSLKDLKLELPVQENSISTYAGYICTEMIAGNIAPMAGLSMLDELYSESDYEPIYSLWDELSEDVWMVSNGEDSIFNPGLTQENVEQYIVNAAAQFLKR